MSLALPLRALEGQARASVPGAGPGGAREHPEWPPGVTLLLCELGLPGVATMPSLT